MSSAPQPPVENAEGQLGMWDAVSIIVGIVIGTSIYQVPWLIFANVPNPLMGLLVWVVGGALALVGALCYAELATTYPRSGGDYEYLGQAFGPWLGFLFGWAQLAVVLTASIGAMAWVFGDYAHSFYDLTKTIDIGVSSPLLYASLAVLVLTLVNVIGVTLGKWTQNLLTVTKVLGLGGILVAGFGFGTHWGDLTAWEPPASVRDPVFPWGALAIILVLYAYGGWNDAAFVAAEVKDRRRNLPRALLLGTALITVIYLLINVAYLVGLGFEVASRPGRLPTQVLSQVPWEIGGFVVGQEAAKVMSVLVMISALGAVNGLIFAGSRVYATLGADHTLFGFLGGWKPGRGAPAMSLLVQALITWGMIFTLGTREGQHRINEALEWFRLTPPSDWQPGDAFETLVSHTAPVFWFFFLMTGLSLFVLRTRDPERERPFKVPLYPELPLVFCGMCVYMLWQSIQYVGVRALFGFALVALGLPLFRLSQFVSNKR